MRAGDWIQTYSGVQFWPMDPHPAEIVLADVAHALSMQCRFSGHTRRFYSVAEHSVHMAAVALEAFPEQTATRMARWALLHDATEAYLVDVPRPIKPHLVGYKDIERRLMGVVAQRFGLEGDTVPVLVQALDMRILYTERAQLLGTPPHAWADENTEPLPLQLQCWMPQVAKDRFLWMAGRLGIS